MSYSGTNATPCGVPKEKIILKKFLILPILAMALFAASCGDHPGARQTTTLTVGGQTCQALQGHQASPSTNGDEAVVTWNTANACGAASYRVTWTNESTGVNVDETYSLRPGSYFTKTKGFGWFVVDSELFLNGGGGANVSCLAHDVNGANGGGCGPAIPV